ncbi:MULTISPECIES: copper-binding protein [Symbiopectobacterium]|uniref:copper-binding protein n=1 Tax=Symbiopectobacterium TaxID=801 RepID=UPI001A276B54|nr:MULTISPECIES: copper-binding protein [Symbiopectobacterium]MBG6247593.1 copper-binding protein [Candidatus Symbiopectobacterium sp. PLON1]MBT9429710.1 copper-binding protein [Candidatus Symbiopectobacterium endolongispinus]
MRTLLTAIALFASVATTAPAFSETSPVAAHDHNAMMSMDHSNMNHGTQPTSAATVYQGTGVVKAWSDTSVTFAHQPIPALSWPAMTMRFGLSAYKGSPLSVGQKVNFTFIQSASGYDLISASAN